ncbi:putative U6 snRNA-associated Sm-like protein LSm3 [Intoshia linei]|uniref:U6 snRNA-associated Sm-like protein LSm3 n=1 Tax=Intoshia linei TaxID=1819745 RepID=A0A177B5H7_9BILA|nr:putative U6 snRNA-associated Sm-like protein LSm3 [Intoshia linei]
MKRNVPVIPTFQNIKEPLDLIKYSINGYILVKMRNNRIVKGKMNSFDQHLNMILSEVEEETYKVHIDDETYDEVYEKVKRKIPLLFIRGDGIILISVDGSTI